MWWKRERERERETDRQTDRQRQTERDRERERQRQRQTDRQVKKKKKKKDRTAIIALFGLKAVRSLGLLRSVWRRKKRSGIGVSAVYGDSVSAHRNDR